MQRKGEKVPEEKKCREQSRTISIDRPSIFARWAWAALLIARARTQRRPRALRPLPGRDLSAATVARHAGRPLEAEVILYYPFAAARAFAHAARDLTPALTRSQRGRLTLPGAAHHDRVTGPLMARRIAPALKAFMTAGER